jgi:putative addiction module CopG family antidote
MTIHLPEHLERFIEAEVASGHFKSHDELIAEAVSLLLERQPFTAENPLSETELEANLLASGFLASVPAQRDPEATPWNFAAVKIEGEPLSETVIRERR